MDRESAFEMLEKKIIPVEVEQQKASLTNSSRTRSGAKEEDSLIEELSKITLVRQLGRTILEG